MTLNPALNPVLPTEFLVGETPSFAYCNGRRNISIDQSCFNLLLKEAQQEIKWTGVVTLEVEGKNPLSGHSTVFDPLDFHTTVPPHCPLCFGA